MVFQQQIIQHVLLLVLPEPLQVQLIYHVPEILLEQYLLRQQILLVLLSLQLLIPGQAVLRHAHRPSQVLHVLLQQQPHSVIASQVATNIVALPSRSRMNHHLITDLSRAMIIRSPIAALPHDQVPPGIVIQALQEARILQAQIRHTAHPQGVIIHVHTVLLQKAIAVVVVPTLLLQEATTHPPEAVA